MKVNENIQLKGNAVKPKNFNANDVKQVSQLMIDLIRRSRRMTRIELNDWQSARMSRYNRINPTCYKLMQVYDDVMLDGHLTAVTENRTLRSINKKFILLSSDNTIDEEKSKYFQKKWFLDLIEYVHQSVYYGSSVILISEVEKANIKKISLIPREHVNNELGVILREITDQTGLNYNEFPNQLLYAQLYDPIGKLEKAAPYTILKRHSWGSWDEFEEMFGIPIRIAKIASQSDAVKNEVANWLHEMGSAAYGVFPIGTEIEIKENSKTDSFNVFMKKIESLDKELSKLILHQTMTTENGSSRSQGEVHENTLNAVIYTDEAKLINWIQDTLLPVMRYYGYDIPEDYSAGVKQEVDPNRKIEIDTPLLNNGYVLTQNYIESTYGVEIESMPSPLTPKGGNEGGALKKKP